VVSKMKYRLYTSTSGWNSRHTLIKNYLGIPTAETDQYAVISQINNSEHEHFGKYIFPVKTTGTWKCDDQFHVNDLVDYDSSWFVVDEL
tara:strand:+ start:767 stop:1033 length:267 start_codon:yes stop_codon:yes gene_type:complete